MSAYTNYELIESDSEYSEKKRLTKIYYFRNSGPDSLHMPATYYTPPMSFTSRQKLVIQEVSQWLSFERIGTHHEHPFAFSFVGGV